MKTASDGQQRSRADVHRDTSVSPYFAFKAWPTRMVGGVLLVLASPVILLLVIAVRLTSPGPGLYRQERTGRHGKLFMMYKIRTMYSDAESVTGPVWCRPGDSRITPVGRLLRLLHLDELPQLINIARGEMDLIGPRPERPVFVARLVRHIPDYEARLDVLPGVTGLAQVNLPPDETLDCVRRKLVLDCAYIREAGPLLDLRILLCTFLRMLGIRYGRAVRWLRLERHVQLAPLSRAPAFSHWLQEAPHQPAADVQGEINGVAVAVASEPGMSPHHSSNPESNGALPPLLRRPR